MFSKILEEIDKRLMNERDTKVYREKGMKHTCIKTIMGTAQIDRRIKEEYTVVNKTACAGFESSKEFKALTDAAIAEVYNTDEIQTRIINADGA